MASMATAAYGQRGVSNEPLQSNGHSIYQESKLLASLMYLVVHTFVSLLAGVGHKLIILQYSQYGQSQSE